MEFLFFSAASSHAWRDSGPLCRVCSYLTGIFLADHMDLCSVLHKRTHVVSRCSKFSNFKFSTEILDLCLHFGDCKDLKERSFLCFVFHLFYSVPTLTKGLGFLFCVSFHWSVLCCHQPHTPTGKSPMTKHFV